MGIGEVDFAFGVEVSIGNLVKNLSLLRPNDPITRNTNLFIKVVAQSYGICSPKSELVRSVGFLFKGGGAKYPSIVKVVVHAHC